MEMVDGWKKEIVENTAATQTEEVVKREVSKAQKTPSGEERKFEWLWTKRSQSEKKTMEPEGEKMKPSKTKLRAELKMKVKDIGRIEQQ